MSVSVGSTKFGGQILNFTFFKNLEFLPQRRIVKKQSHKEGKTEDLKWNNWGNVLSIYHSREYATLTEPVSVQNLGYLMSTMFVTLAYCLLFL